MSDKINTLLANNRSWAEKVIASKPDFFTESAKGQAPKVLWFGCGDSRVPESVIMGCSPGDMFVHRNIANQFRPDDASANALLQFAVENVGVEHVIVVGHTECGGAAACLAGTRGSMPIDPKSTLANFLSPILSLAKELGLADEKIPQQKAMQMLIEENVRRQVSNIIDTGVMKGIWEKGKNVQVHGWVYNLSTGLISDLKVTHGIEAASGASNKSAL